MTLNLVTTCDLATILQRPFFNLLHKTIRFVTLYDLVTVFEETKSVTKSRLHCTKITIWRHFGQFFCSRIEFLPIAQLLALVIYESVSLVRENLRGLRENIKHKNRTWVHWNSWQLLVSLISVQMALNPLAPTALSATKNL